MKKLLIEISDKDKFLSWVDNGKSVVIVGSPTQDIATKQMQNFVAVNNLKCNFGYYNACNTEVLTRLIKALLNN